MGININGTNKINIILIGIYTTYSILYQIPLLNAHPIPLASSLIGMPKTQALFDERSLIEFM